MTLTFHEHWISEAQLQVTASLAAGTNDLPGDAVEIGVHQGLSAVTIANAVYPGKLHAVDHWDWPAALASDGRYDPADHKGSLEKIQLSQETFSRDNYGVFLKNIKEGTKGNIQIWKMSWQEFTGKWDGPVRFLHIDATHTAEDVAGNIAALLPFAVPGAVFCGDDYPYPPVTEGVHRHFKEVNTGPGALWWITLK